jgi:hypothetical protein
MNMAHDEHIQNEIAVQVKPLRKRAEWYEITSLYVGKNIVLGTSPMHALQRAIRRRKATAIGTSVRRID